MTRPSLVADREGSAAEGDEVAEAPLSFADTLVR